MVILQEATSRPRTQRRQQALLLTLPHNSRRTAHQNLPQHLVRTRVARRTIHIILFPFLRLDLCLSFLLSPKGEACAVHSQIQQHFRRLLRNSSGSIEYFGRGCFPYLSPSIARKGTAPRSAKTTARGD